MAERASILDFFSHDPARVSRALPLLDGSAGEIRTTEGLSRHAGSSTLDAHRAGIFSTALCGDDRFAHVEVPTGVVHPAVYGALLAVFPELDEGARHMAHGELALGDEELTGASGLAEALRRRAPDHPLLPLCELRRIPVPPLATRPLLPHADARMPDPWIGPINESWLDFVESARRVRVLADMDGVPALIMRSEIGSLQRAFERVIERTVLSKLVAPLRCEPTLDVQTPTHSIALAFAGEDRLVLQQGARVHVLGLDGTERIAPTWNACVLRGVSDERFALFAEYGPHMHPAFCEGLEFAGPRASRAAGYWQLDWTNEISALDLRSGAYRETLPPRAPLHLVLNGEPEEIFVESVFTPESRVALRVGGDRPELLAYSHDMTFAWVGESRDTLVVDCATGRPVVYPAHADAIECDDAEAPEDCGGNALGFGEGHFWFLWYGRWLANHLADSPVRLPWTSRASAFDREARRLALVVGDEILVVDREGFTVRARFPLPARS